MTLESTEKFVILSPARSGSGWLMDMLNNVDGCECHGELLLPQPVLSTPVAGCYAYKRYIEIRKDYCWGIRPFSIFSYLNGLYQRHGSVGYKLMYSQLKLYPETALYMIAKRIRMINLVRENLLDIVISDNLTKKIGRAHDSSHGQKTLQTEVFLDPQETLNQLRRLERTQKFIDNFFYWMPCPKIRVSYEQLNQDPASFGQVTKFLCLGNMQELPTSNFVKRQKKRHCDSILNFNEIEKVLKAQGYGHFISPEQC